MGGIGPMGGIRPMGAKERITMNRIEAHATQVRKVIDSGVKPDGDPIGDLEALDRELAVSFLEHAKFQDLQAEAHALGILSTEEAQTVYVALGEVGSSKNGGWAAGTDLALKVSVTELMKELLHAKLRASA